MALETLSRLVPEAESFMACPPDSPRLWSIPDDSVPSIFGLAEFDRIIAAGLPERHVRMTLDNAVVPQADYTWGSRAPKDRLKGAIKPHTINRLIRSGATLVVNELEYFSDPVGDLCRRLVLETGQRATAGAFLTPASSSGLAAHQDVESVLLIQTYGSKRWQLTASTRPRRLDSGPLNAEDTERVQRGEPDLEVTLKVGDALWIPRGWIHANTTTEASLHLTVGFTPYTRHWLAREVIRGLEERISDSDAFRADLPWGIAAKTADIEAEIAAVVDQLSATVRGLSRPDLTARVSRTMGERALAPRRSHPVSTAVESDVTLDTRVVLVAEAVSRTERLTDGKLRLDLRDTVVTVSAAAGDWLETRLAGDDAAVWRTGDMVPELSEKSAIELMGTLIRQGVARAA